MDLRGSMSASDSIPSPCGSKKKSDSPCQIKKERRA